jgi:hypothetical protein
VFSNNISFLRLIIVLVSIIHSVNSYAASEDDTELATKEDYDKPKSFNLVNDQIEPPEIISVYDDATKNVLVTGPEGEVEVQLTMHTASEFKKLGAVLYNRKAKKVGVTKDGEEVLQFDYNESE